MIVGKWHQTLEAYDDNSNHVIDQNEDADGDGFSGHHLQF